MFARELVSYGMAIKAGATMRISLSSLFLGFLLTISYRLARRIELSESDF